MKVRLLPILIGIMTVFNGTLSAQEPSVENVDFIQHEDSNVEIAYDLLGDPAKKYTVRLRLTKPGSRTTYPVRQEMLSGDIGDGVSSGRGLRIIWNLQKDYPHGLEGEDFVFVVEVLEQKRGRSPVPWILGGLAVAGVGVAYLLLGTDPPPTSAEPLPFPEDFPN